MTLKQRMELLADRVQKLDDVITHEKYRDLVAGLRLDLPTSASSPGQQEKKDYDPCSPDELRQKFTASTQEGSRLRVGIIGRVKAGKSSLLNALLFDGKDVLPKAATPMTASLTVLGYADTPYAEVEFFEPQDIENMRQRAQDYDREFDKRVKEKLEKALARPPARSTRGVQLPPPDKTRIEAAVRLELDSDPTLGGSKKLFNDIQKTGSHIPASPQRIEAGGIQNLLDKLEDYVGAQGKYTPFTKCMSIYMPLDPLKTLEVVDTPGVNDPIVSREKRTFDELHKCHAVFVVSPSGQFLNEQDLNLMQRLVRQDGVEEVFLAASQIDTQMFGSEHQRHDGRLPDVLQGLRDTLAQQARVTLPNPQEGGKGLDTLKRELNTRMVVTSSVAYTLSSQPEEAWDGNTRHIHGMLRQHYSAEFAQPHAAARAHYETIAGVKETLALLDQVRERRLSIIESNLQSFLDAQEKVLQQRLKDIPFAVGKQRAQVENADGDTLDKQLQAIQQASKKGVRVVDAAVGSIAQETASFLSDHMNAAVEKILDDLKRTAERAKGTATSSHTVEKDGLVAWFARTVGLGGTERRTETVSTVNATEIRTALDKVHDDLVKTLTAIVGKGRQGLRPMLEGQILRELREGQVIADSDIDITLLGQSCQSVMGNLRDFDEPVLPPLPDVLMQSGTLKSGAAERYETEALAYFQQLQKAARAASRTLTRGFEDRLRSAELGTALFEEYQTRAGTLKQQIEEKTRTLQRYDSLLAELRELR